jgi:predicted HTH transcriptional regulator
MSEHWTQKRVEEFIVDEIEEGHQLEDKSSGALEKSYKTKQEMAKDVSSMANSAGGIIIYGIKEFDKEEKKHLPESLDPINRQKFS